MIVDILIFIGALVVGAFAACVVVGTVLYIQQRQDEYSEDDHESRRSRYDL